MTIETVAPELPTAMESGLKTREFRIKAGNTGHSVTVIQLTDLHIGCCNEEDMKNPTLASTYANRKWPSQSRVLQNLDAALNYADSQNPDQIVITGDALDYLSLGGLELLQDRVWDRYPADKLLIATGNHDMVQKMQGTVEESLSAEERYAFCENIGDTIRSTPLAFCEIRSWSFRWTTV